MENIFDPGILKKLRVNVDSEILIINSPENYLDLFSPDGCRTVFTQEDKGRYDFVQVFGSSRTELDTLILQVKEAGKYDCLFWACYPKGTGKIISDIKRDTVWNAFDLIGLQAVSQIAIDDTWSALRARPKNAVGK